MTLPHRIEAAEGADRALDAEIELAIGNWSPEHYEAWHRYQQCGESVNPPMCAPVDPQWFTASIDAALTLVPEGWKLRQMSFSGPCADDRKWHLNLHGGKVGEDTFVGRGATPALALCAAALKAHIERKEG